MTAVAVFVGGGLGSLGRWLVSIGSQRLWPGAVFPWGTFVVNVVGCFLLGLLAQLFAHRMDLPVHLRVGLTTGFMGGLTTFSTFGNESIRLLETGPAWGALNVVANVVVGLGAAALGLWLGARMAA